MTNWMLALIEAAAQMSDGFIFGEDSAEAMVVDSGAITMAAAVGAVTAVGTSFAVTDILTFCGGGDGTGTGVAMSLSAVASGGTSFAGCTVRAFAVNMEPVDLAIGMDRAPAFGSGYQDSETPAVPDDNVPYDLITVDDGIDIGRPGVVAALAVDIL